MASRLLKDQSGFQHPADPMIPPVMMFVVFVIALPSLWNARETAALSKAWPSVRCMKNLLLIQRGADPQELACPVADQPYAVQHENDRDILSCPDRGRHLGFAPRLVRDGDSWALDLGAGDFPPPVERTLELSPGEGGSAVLEVPEALFIRLSQSWIIAFFALPFAFGLCWLALGRDWSMAPVLFLVGLVILATVAVVPIFGQKITIRPENVVVQRSMLGVNWWGPEHYQRGVIVFPVFTGELSFIAMLIHDDQRKLQHRALFSTSKDQWKVVSVLNERLAR